MITPEAAKARDALILKLPAAVTTHPLWRDYVSEMNEEIDGYHWRTFDVQRCIADFETFCEEVKAGDFNMLIEPADEPEEEDEPEDEDDN